MCTLQYYHPYRFLFFICSQAISVATMWIAHMFGNWFHPFLLNEEFKPNGNYTPLKCPQYLARSISVVWWMKLTLSSIVISLRVQIIWNMYFSGTLPLDLTTYFASPTTLLRLGNCQLNDIWNPEKGAGLYTQPLCQCGCVCCHNG